MLVFLKIRDFDFTVLGWVFFVGSHFIFLNIYEGYKVWHSFFSFSLYEIYKIKNLKSLKCASGKHLILTYPKMS